MSQHWSPEVGNVYACTAWAGWAHFVYAFRGQGSALVRIRERRLALYVACLALTTIALLGARYAMGVSLFGAVVWVYFIDHFLIAEQSFEGRSTNFIRWVASYQPLLTFTWLSLVLLDVGKNGSLPWVIWIVSLALGALVLCAGGWKKLSIGDARSPLLSLFFVAEALVWGTVGRYGGPTFLAGVYVFHIAAGSYFHYFGSYFFGHAKAKTADKLLTPWAILAINSAIIGLGWLTAFYEPLFWLKPILGVQWFTLWVALHLAASDIFPFIKKWRARA